MTEVRIPKRVSGSGSEADIRKSLVKREGYRVGVSVGQ